MVEKHTICEVGELEKLAIRLKELSTELDRSVVLLKGDLGSGKTALVKSYIEMEGSDQADSPTFALLNEYSAGGGIYH